MSRELTASQHTAIRRQLALIPAYIWSLYIWGVTVSQLPFERFSGSWRVFRDFAHFYVLGAIAARHEAALLHDAVAQRALVLGLGIRDHVDALFAPSYGPQVALLFRPFAYLSYTNALLVWLSVTLALTGAALFPLWRRTACLRAHAWPCLVLLVSAPALHMTLMYGQTSAVALALFSVAYLCADRSKPWLAGAAIGALFYKPQLGVAAAVLFTATGQWRVVGGAVAAIGAQLLAVWAYWGAGALSAYGRAVLAIPSTLAAIEPELQHLHSFRAQFQLMGLEGRWLHVCTAIASVVALRIGLDIWRRHGDTRVRFAALLLVTPLVDLHMYVYDLLIVLPVCVWLADYGLALRGSRVQRWHLPIVLAALIYVSPLLEAAAVPLRLQPSVLILLTTLLWLSRPRREWPASAPAACQKPRVSYEF